MWHVTLWLCCSFFVPIFPIEQKAKVQRRYSEGTAKVHQNVFSWFHYVFSWFHYTLFSFITWISLQLCKRHTELIDTSPKSILFLLTAFMLDMQSLGWPVRQDWMPPRFLNSLYPPRFPSLRMIAVSDYLSPCKKNSPQTLAHLK